MARAARRRLAHAHTRSGRMSARIDPAEQDNGAGGQHRHKEERHQNQRQPHEWLDPGHERLSGHPGRGAHRDRQIEQAEQVPEVEGQFRACRRLGERDESQGDQCGQDVPPTCALREHRREHATRAQPQKDHAHQPNTVQSNQDAPRQRVVAGPGAGKTYCLISRIQHLIAGGISPHRICAVTFTNRAAEEIARRNTHDVSRGTIHAFCLALLREFAADADLRRGFGVADDPYQRVILSRLRVPLDRRGQLLTLFSRHRFQGYRLTDGDARLLREYVSWLRARNMVDFDELITKAAPLAGRVADRWDYVLVDEFQDVNAVQYDLLKRLAEPHGNFFAVADDEQSIFAWTGADPMLLDRFRRDYDVEPIILDKNRRCSRQIFETARRVLAQNPQIFQKQLTADKESPYAVVAHAFRH